MARSAKHVKLIAILESSEHAAGWHFVKVPRVIGERFPSDGRSRRVVCTLNESETIQCALMPSGGDFLILVNKRVRTALGVLSGDKLELSLSPDTSRYGLPMPEEFEEVLKQDAEGDKLFHALTPGRQRSLIFLVTSGKDVDKRIHKALLIVEHLKENDGRIDSVKLYREKRPLV